MPEVTDAFWSERPMKFAGGAALFGVFEPLQIL